MAAAAATRRTVRAYEVKRDTARFLRAGSSVDIAVHILPSEIVERRTGGRSVLSLGMATLATALNSGEYFTSYELR
jgi:hypothetical protein